MADDQHWLRLLITQNVDLLELYWSSGKGLNTNKHVNGFLLKYSIVQNVFKCLIRLSPHDVSTSICMKKINQSISSKVYWIFVFSFFYQFLGSFANNQHFYTFLAKIVFALKWILPLTALQLTRCFNIKWMVNGSVFKLFLQ